MTQGTPGAAAGGHGPDDESSPRPARGAGESPAGSQTVKIVTSQELMGNAREILILHNDTMYRLRKTRQGKLVLGK